MHVGDLINSQSCHQGYRCLQTLVSVSTVGTVDKMSEADLVKSVKRELKEWFGPEASSWVFMRNYRIPYAQPNQVSSPSSF